MHIFKTLLFITAMSIPAHVSAQTADPTAQVVTTQEVVHVSVNGLVCDFCARALEKVFSKKNEVSSIDVDLDAKVVTIKFHEGKTLDDDTITKLIMDSGYSVESVHRG